MGTKVTVAVTDVGGHLVAFQRSDGAKFLTERIAIDKAWTAVSFGISTKLWASALTDPAITQMGNIPRLLAAGGGYPIIEDGDVIGGLGVSGGTHDQDEQVAEAALRALSFPV